MLKVAEDPDIYKYTGEDLEALKPFIAHLRNSLILDQQESDARTPEGAVTYPLSTDHVRKKIKTDPTLRYLWKRLTPAQQAYAENRYIQNTPTRYETMEAMTPNPFAAPLEHDYHLTHNPLRYKSGRVIQNSGLGLARSGVFTPGLVGSIIKPLSRVGDAVVERLPGTVRTTGKAGADVAEDATVALNRGGYSQYTQSGDSRELADQPLGVVLRKAESAASDLSPAVVDMYTFGNAIPGVIGHTTAAIPRAISNTSKMIGSFSNPVNSIMHPKQWAKSFVKGKFFGAFPLLDAATDVKSIYSILTDPGYAEKNTVASSEAAKAFEAMVYGGSKDPKTREAIQRYVESKRTNTDSDTESTTEPADEHIADNRPATKPDFLGKYKTHGAGALIGGGLGAALDRRSRLRGFLIGSLLGAAAPALYNYVKKRYS